MIAPQASASPTPTYDPLVEPPLPSNPTEYELGRNLYWHWCMTCHGDRGQGLTDEFRGIWEPEHQNCWGRGCHAGRPGDEGFPIPTVVPALVNENHLAQFTSLPALADFLKATHPPQSPGILKTEEYHAIALFVFTLNKRSLVSVPITDTPTPASTPTRALIPSEEAVSRTSPGNATIILVILGSILLVLTIKKVHVQR
jgi:cytochrome c